MWERSCVEEKTRTAFPKNRPASSDIADSPTPKYPAREGWSVAWVPLIQPLMAMTSGCLSSRSAATANTSAVRSL